jgi:hypothetical protein
MLEIPYNSHKGIYAKKYNNIFIKKRIFWLNKKNWKMKNWILFFVIGVLKWHYCLK